MKDLTKVTQLAGGTEGIRTWVFWLSSQWSFCCCYGLLPHQETEPKYGALLSLVPTPPHQTGGPSRAVQEPELGGQLPWGPASVWTASSSSSTSERTLRRRHGSTRHAAGGEGFRPPGGRGAQNRRRRECLERRPVLSRGGAQGEEGRRMLIL